LERLVLRANASNFAFSAALILVVMTAVSAVLMPPSGNGYAIYVYKRIFLVNAATPPAFARAASLCRAAPLIVAAPYPARSSGIACYKPG
jgi:hypothetical protein